MKYVLLVIATILVFAWVRHPKTALIKDEVSAEGIKTIENMPQEQKIVCNDFGIAYYEFATTHSFKVYIPVFRHYSTGEFPMSCEEYNNYINKRNANEKMSR